MIAVRRLGFCVLLLAAGIWIVFSPQSSRAQQETVAKRRLVDRVAPPYPALARSMALEGVVKVEALVAPDGSVKTVDIIRWTSSPRSGGAECGSALEMGACGPRIP